MFIKKMALAASLMFLVLSSHAQENIYRGYGEKGVYDFKVSPKGFELKNEYKFKEKQGPYVQFYTDEDLVITYNTIDDQYNNIVCKFDYSSREFKELYRIKKDRKYPQHPVSIKDYLYLIERDIDTDKYYLTKRSFDSPEVLETTPLNFKFNKEGSFCLTDGFFYKDYLVANFSSDADRSHCFIVMSKSSGQQLVLDSGNLHYQSKPDFLYIIENSQKIFQVELEGKKYEKKEIKTFLPKGQSIGSFLHEKDFCVFETYYYKHNFFTQFTCLAGVRHSTWHYCYLKENELVSVKKIKGLKLGEL